MKYNTVIGILGLVGIFVDGILFEQTGNTLWIAVAIGCAIVPISEIIKNNK